MDPQQRQHQEKAAAKVFGKSGHHARGTEASEPCRWACKAPAGTHTPQLRQHGTTARQKQARLPSPGHPSSNTTSTARLLPPFVSSHPLLKRRIPAAIPGLWHDHKAPAGGSARCSLQCCGTEPGMPTQSWPKSGWCWELVSMCVTGWDGLSTHSVRCFLVLILAMKVTGAHSYSNSEDDFPENRTYQMN